MAPAPLPAPRGSTQDAATAQHAGGDQQQLQKAGRRQDAATAQHAGGDQQRLQKAGRRQDAATAQHAGGDQQLWTGRAEGQALPRLHPAKRNIKDMKNLKVQNREDGIEVCDKE